MEVPQLVAVGHDSTPITICHVKIFQEMVICLACGFGCLRLEDDRNMKGEGRIFSIIFKFFGFDKAKFLHFKEKILEHLAHKILGRFFLDLSIQLFLFTELTNTFSGFEIAHIFVHQ